MTIGEKIKACRKLANLTQVKLSEISGVAQSTIAQYENGYMTPSLSQAWLLADALGISVDQFRPDIITDNYNPEA